MEDMEPQGSNGCLKSRFFRWSSGAEVALLLYEPHLVCAMIVKQEQGIVISDTWFFQCKEFLKRLLTWNFRTDFVPRTFSAGVTRRPLRSFPKIWRAKAVLSDEETSRQ